MCLRGQNRARHRGLSNNIIRRFLTTCLCTFSINASAQNHAETTPLSLQNERHNSTYAIDISIFNRYDDHRIDPMYMGNSEVFRMLDSLMQDTVIINHTKTINVVSSSSIEGSVAYNTALSQRRMNMVEATFRSRYSYLSGDIWNFSYVPENWTHLRGAVVGDANVPYQDEVLLIIDMEDRHPDDREHLLKGLNSGVPWSYIHQHILPSSRGCVSMLFVPMILTPIGTVDHIPALDIKNPLLERPEPIPIPSAPRYSRPIVSLRSNLLLDLTSTLNFGVEVPLSPRLSVSAEYVTPWWKSWDHAFTWQIESLYFDFRYWFGDRGVHNYLTGLSAGVYAGSGRYDLQPFTDEGVQGEYSDFGVTLSYSHRLGQSKHWLMEYTVGLGYVTTHYRNYYAASDTDEYGDIKVLYYPWSEETLRAALPTRLGVTLCYLINIKKGGRR